ncbi:hypothetical protein BABINDRAFT_161567 [Babjeviella inositovora NRRL Y-12698]|uniref:4-hydroxy-4-methyl-2-oxoglutarate aldolase n=1 Tax=Babjeviella inositovora NRRL Y-12698 TaxID=984486 RepID=A0A1E3QSI3_9ASCO|nr:uncharacterized protein BABINDRAFT_161567 [Babjeviella inositovora NRRL Y-12698]ODQ79897.1 hypothetical protein BABINDRAFT_161567 [Babjeviella inositovora NRRL Y-12698]
MSKVSTTKKVLQTLTQFTPCDVSDALVKFGDKSGGYFPNLTNYSSPSDGSSVSGKAFTVLYAPLSDPRPAVAFNYIDCIPSPADERILVIGLTPNLQTANAPYHTLTNALYGGLMSTRANYVKCRGSVVFGRIRDVSEHRSLGYPVWSYGVGSTAPKVSVKVVAVGEPIDVVMYDGVDGKQTQMRINDGDYIVADAVNGVVRIAEKAGLLEKVLEYMPRAVAADELVAEDIKQGVEAGKAQKARRANL